MAQAQQAAYAQQMQQYAAQQAQQAQQQQYAQQMQAHQQQQMAAQQQQQAGAGQQQQAWGQQAQAQAGGQSKDVTLVVQGCTHATVGGIVRGSFQLAGENHGKPAYKKDGQVNGLDVMTYFWDERDGPGFCGWWFGPKVGGDQVWAYHNDKTAAMPPQTGWKVPYDGPVDQTFVIGYKPKGGAAAPQQQQQQQYTQAQQQQWAQQQQAQGGGNAQQQQLAMQRQQLEQLKQQQAQQNGAQANQMRQQQMMQQQARMEDNKKKLEEANKKRLAEQQMHMEKMKAQQAELLAKRAEEAAKRAAELEIKQKEQVSVLAIRKAIQQFRATPPEKYDELKTALDEAASKELEGCGSQKERVTTEIEQAVVATKQRLEQMAEMKKKQEEAKAAEDVRRKECKVKAEALLVDLEKLVEKVETSSKSVVDDAEPLLGEKELKIAEIEKFATKVEETGKEAATVAQECTEFAVKESPAIKNTPPISGETEPATCGADLVKLMTRLNDAKKATTAALQKCAFQKGLRIKKAHAKDKHNKGLTSFKKYAKDGKGAYITRKEIQAFAKGEHSFALPADTLESICSHLVKDGAKGVDQADYFRMKVMIGISREAGLDAKRKAAREAREKQIADIKEKLQAKVAAAAEVVKAATEAVVKAEAQVKPLTIPAETKTKTSTEMIALANETDAVTAETKASLTAATDAIKALQTDEAELKGFLAGEVKKLNQTMQPLEGRNNKATASSTKFRAEASKKDNIELEKLRKDGLAMIFFHQGAKKLTCEQVYDELDKKKSGKIQEAAFVKFFKACEKKEDAAVVSEEDAGRLFAHVDTESAGSVSKEQFLNLIRKFMKVIKASVLTKDISIKSEAVRRIEEGEVVECLTGPTTEDGADVSRVQVKAMNDDVVGWVTPVGNQGTEFLKDGGNIFKVVKETILTGSFVIGEDTKTKDRKMKIGEIVTVVEWAKKEEVSGLMRMKVQVKSDKQIGYATSVGNTGIKFLECL